MTSLTAEVSLAWAGGEYVFALKGKQIEGLEHDCNEGIAAIAMHVFAGADFRYKHIERTLYWGLVGGGMNMTEAAKLIQLYVAGGVPLDAKGDPASNLKTASAVLKAVFFGWESLPKLGEAGGGETPPKKQTSGSSEQPFSQEELTPAR